MKKVQIGLACSLNKTKGGTKKKKKHLLASVWPEYFAQYAALAEEVLGHSLTGTADDH